MPYPFQGALSRDVAAIWSSYDMALILNRVGGPCQQQFYAFTPTMILSSAVICFFSSTPPFR